MDSIAAEAGVSKRTVYNNFADKPVLFREVVLAATGAAAQLASEVETLIAGPAELPGALNELARRLTAATLDTRVLALRRLLIGEAHRFPELAAEYYERAPGKVIAALAAGFERLHGEGRLKAPDPRRAAEEFAFLTLGPALDRALFEGEVRPRAAARAAEQGVRTFLAAYGAAA